MKEKSNRVVKDFFHGLKIFGLTMGYSIMLIAIIIFFALSVEELSKQQNTILIIIIVSIFVLSILFSIIGFIINYIPIKIVNGIVSIPASDQIRTFTDVITINPITGLYRRRTYNVNEIENVANGYTRVKREKEREWNVVISGIKNGRSFSQKIDCSNKQVRDEVRNVLKQTISGRVNADFAI